MGEDVPDPVLLIVEIRSLVEAARTAVAREVNTLMVLTRFEIGRRIVVHEQEGQVRAGYGRAVLQSLSDALTREFGRGWSVDNLSLMRRFFLRYRDRGEISETASRISPATSTQDVSALGRTLTSLARSSPFTLSWSHYVFLIGIDDASERSFYEIEASRNGWSLRELRRQFDTSLFERLALSRDKQGVRALATDGQIVEKASDMLKDPYVLEFLGLEERHQYSESDLENRIISKLEHFLLELGRGFLFEGRQRRFSFDEEHYYVDLVFYNRLLRCFVLIDLKIGKITHQDLGQMQMYVNYYDRHVKLDEEGPTVGILLCKRKNDALVEITLPEASNVHAREYSLVIPSKADLQRKLLEWSDVQEE